MNTIKDFDNFTANPITAFKNAGYYRHRTGWNCTQKTDHAVFFCVEWHTCSEMRIADDTSKYYNKL